MSNKRHKISITITGGADIRKVLLQSLTLALLCVLFTIPYFYHLLSVSFKTQDRVPMPSNFLTVMSMDLFLLFIACLLSAIAGFSFSKKQQLPGFGDLRRIKETFPLLLMVVTAVGILTYLFFDRHFFYISPESYPRNTLYLIAYPLKLAFMNEVILRFGLVTIAIGFLKQRIGGVIAISGIAAIFTMKYFRFMGIDYPYNTLYITQFVLSFSVNFILGYVFITRGLIHAMVLHFLFGLRLPIVLWALG